MEKYTNGDYISSNAIIDSDHSKIIEYAHEVAGESSDPVKKAVNLYYAVRDGILYDPYTLSDIPEDYLASNVLARGRGFCVQKAGLLCALGRACGIPSRVGFATVRNHLASQQLIQFIGSNVFVYHGYTEFILEGKWIKATPAFNSKLCRLYKLEPLEFDGKEDSIFQEYDGEKKLFMEYVEDLGTSSTIPVKSMVDTWREFYGIETTEKWFKRIRKSKGLLQRDFFKENPLSP